MNRAHVSVLILGERQEGFSYLMRHLEQQGSQCSFAQSPEEGLARFAAHSFDLILSARMLDPTDALPLLLNGATSRAFYCLPVEDGCWWLPLVCCGERCLGAPAFRPSEFVGELDRVVKQMRLGAQPECALASPVAA